MTIKRGLPVVPDPNASIEEWQQDPDTMKVTAQRQAAFWTALRGNKVACNLCYRVCVLNPGETGWCGVRENVNGQMEIPAHGVLATGFRYVMNDWSAFQGETALYLSGVSCTSRCSFCTSTRIALAPDLLPWGQDTERVPAMLAEWSYHRAMLHPTGAIALARHFDVTGIHLGGNEPTLTWEWSFDTARLARDAGLWVHMATNGYTEPEAIQAIAPWIDSVLIGVKGECSDPFYARHMRSPGAAAMVKRGIKAWQDAGVAVAIGDVVAPPMWVDDAGFEQTATAFYSWIAETIGPLTPLEIMPMVKPQRDYCESGIEPLLPRNATAEDASRHNQRTSRAIELARECGLQYVYVLGADVACHSCGGLLTSMRGRHVTDGHCNHCGVAVPIVTR